MNIRVLSGAAGLVGAVVVLGQMSVNAGTGVGQTTPSNSGVESARGEFVPTGGPIGPDVIVGSLPDTVRWATSGTETAYSMATTSCNVGDQDLDWISEPSNRHPVIGQNMYRLSAEGRFEHIGQAWLKHSFCALQQTLSGCGSCSGGFGCLSVLHPGCADPYSASRNGGQSGLGPKWQINAHTGEFPVPWAQGEGTAGSYRRRLRVDNDYIQPALNPGAEYFIEGQYVTKDDSDWGNQNNNASYRKVLIQSDLDLTLSGPTVMMRPAIFAWKTADSEVELTDIQVPDEGHFKLGHRVFDNGDGTWRYEYAMYNMNSDQSGRSFVIPMPAGVTLTDVGFHDIDYHSGEPWDGTDWPNTIAGGECRWETSTYASDPEANALRWGTLYNFWFTADSPPVAVTGRMDMFKPGATTFVEFDTVGPEPQATPCPADVDGDGSVGFTDLLAVLGEWGPCPGCNEDVDGDGAVGFTDLLTVLGEWGPCP